jgi:hypothetical protein
VMHLASHALLDLMLAFPHQGAICYLQIKNVLKVLCNRLECLVAKTLIALKVLRPVLFVKVGGPVGKFPPPLFFPPRSQN